MALELASDQASLYFHFPSLPGHGGANAGTAFAQRAWGHRFPRMRQHEGQSARTGSKEKPASMQSRRQ